MKKENSIEIFLKSNEKDQTNQINIESKINEKLFSKNYEDINQDNYSDITDTNIMTKQLLNMHNCLYEFDFLLPKFGKNNNNRELQIGGSKLIVNEPNELLSLLENSSEISIPVNSEEYYSSNDSFSASNFSGSSKNEILSDEISIEDFIKNL
ncbi:Hypothetical protein KVN_LOCUS419 [uncultured virus]|nr:Hypothetical protein KVN_LOCUS419 [uncultured virus]